MSAAKPDPTFAPLNSSNINCCSRRCRPKPTFNPGRRYIERELWVREKSAQCQFPFPSFDSRHPVWSLVGDNFWSIKFLSKSNFGVFLPYCFFFLSWLIENSDKAVYDIERWAIMRLKKWFSRIIHKFLEPLESKCANAYIRFLSFLSIWRGSKKRKQQAVFYTASFGCWETVQLGMLGGRIFGFDMGSGSGCVRFCCC